MKENLKVQSARKATKSRSNHKRDASDSHHNAFIFQINPPTITQKPKHCYQKEETRLFYIDLLRKLELLRFTSNLIDIKEEKKKKREPSISIETIRLDGTPNHLEVFQVICSKYGRDYYGMLNRIFSMYAIHKQNTIVINLRQFNIFLKDFFPDWIQAQILPTQIEILYKRVVKTLDFADLKAFIELLYEFFKIKSKKTAESFKMKFSSNIRENEIINVYYPKEAREASVSKDQAFKRFLDEEIMPKYKILCNKVKEPGYEKIQIFFEQYDENDNPILDLLLEKENLLKHVFSVYEILDIGVSKQSFIDLKGFLRFCSDYSIIPNISNGYQITKIFMTYKKYETNSIDYSCFVILVCCIAHIGINKSVQFGFYEKMKKLVCFLEKNNDRISEKLIINKLLK